MNRDQLYAEVWAEPMTAVAAKYQVSSSFLARVCAQMRVPRPARGYWARLKVGSAPEVPALPEPKPGDLIEWTRGGGSRSMPTALPKAPEPGARRIRRARTDRSSQHTLLARAADTFTLGRESDHGYLRPNKRLLPDLFVSKEALHRALDLANSLYLTLEERGHQAVIAPRDGPYRRIDLDEREKNPRGQSYHSTWQPARPTLVFIGTLGIGLTIYEMSEQVEVFWKDGKYIRVDDPVSRKNRRQSVHTWTTQHDLPSGRLSIRAYSPYFGASWSREWRESEPGSLMGQFDSIARSLEREAPAIAGLVEEAHQRLELERAAMDEQFQRWRLEQEERRRAQARKDSREELLAIIDAWSFAKRVQLFFEEAEAEAAHLDEQQRAAILERIGLARDLIGGTEALGRLQTWRAPSEH